jgi:hypothetical protein
MWGGVFVDRTAALKFAMSENGRPRAVVMVPYPFELAIAMPPDRPAAEAVQAAAPPRAA